MSRRTQLPVVVLPHSLAQSEKVQAGQHASARILVFLDRSRFDYSDEYGIHLPGQIQAGLYQHPGEETIETKQAIAIIVKPVVQGEGSPEIQVDNLPQKLQDKPLRPERMQIEKRFNLNMAVFDSHASSDDVAAAEQLPDIQMVNIQNPSVQQIQELQAKGYFYKPEKIAYAIDLPQAGMVPEAMEQYYARFDSKQRRQFKTDVRKIDEAIGKQDLRIVDSHEDTSAIEDFLKLYRNVMRSKIEDLLKLNPKVMGSNEREWVWMPLIDSIEKSGLSPREYMNRNERLGIFLRNKEGRVVGGVITRRYGDHYSINYAATDRNAGYRSLQFYLMQTMMQRSISEGLKTMSYGVDRNLYGHHLNVGLMQAKINSGFRPVEQDKKEEQKKKELMKITKFDVFNKSVFFYTFGQNGQLESNVILTEETRGRVEEFEGATKKLNIFILEGNQLKPVRKEELMEKANQAMSSKISKRISLATVLRNTKLLRTDFHFLPAGQAGRRNDRKGNGDKAMRGGIDLTPANMHLQTKVMDSRLRGNDSRGNGNGSSGIQFHISPAMLAQLQNAPGFTPVIINIQPMNDLKVFLGIEESVGNSQGVG